MRWTQVEVGFFPLLVYWAVFSIVYVVVRITAVRRFESAEPTALNDPQPQQDTAGWFLDDESGERLRYHDGTDWTSLSIPNDDDPPLFKPLGFFHHNTAEECEGEAVFLARRFRSNPPDPLLVVDYRRYSLQRAAAAGVWVAALATIVIAGQRSGDLAQILFAGAAVAVVPAAVWLAVYWRRRQQFTRGAVKGLAHSNRFTVLSGVVEPFGVPVETIGGRALCVFAALEISFRTHRGTKMSPWALEFGDRSFYLRLADGSRVLIDMTRTSRFRWATKLAEGHIPFRNGSPGVAFGEYGLKVGQRVTVGGALQKSPDGPVLTGEPINIWFGDQQGAFAHLRNEYMYVALWVISVPFAVPLLVLPLVAAFNSTMGLLVLTAALIASPFAWMWLKRRRGFMRRARWMNLDDSES